MKWIEALVIGLLAWLLACSLGIAQTGPVGQPASGWHGYPKLTKVYNWAPVEGKPDWVALYKHNEQVGAYSWSEGFYYAKKGSGWTPPTKAPIPPPFARGEAAGEPVHFGLAMRGVPSHEKFWCGSTVYSHAEAAQLLEADLRDDQKNPHVTVIDRDAARRKRLLEEIAISKWKGELPQKARVQVYDPNLAPVRAMLAPFRLDVDQQFQQSGCVVLAQAAAKDPSGKSRPHRIYGDATPQALIDALRTVDPTYDPNINPWPKWPTIPSIPTEAIVIACLLLLLVGVAIGRRSS